MDIGEWKYGKKLPPGAVEAVESAFSLNLDPAYRLVVSQHDGGRPAHHCFDAAGQQRVFEDLLSLRRPAEATSTTVWTANGEHPPEGLPTDLFAFATASGGTLCFHRRSGEVVLWTNEVEALNVAENFADLLRKLSAS